MSAGFGEDAGGCCSISKRACHALSTFWRFFEGLAVATLRPRRRPRPGEESPEGQGPTEPASEGQGGLSGLSSDESTRRTLT